MLPELLGALSEGQRAIAHLGILVALALALALVYLIRRRGRRPEETDENRAREDD